MCKSKVRSLLVCIIRFIIGIAFKGRTIPSDIQNDTFPDSQNDILLNMTANE